MFEALATLVKPPSKEMLHAIRFPLLEDVVCGFLGALIFAVAEKKHINLPKKSSKLNSMVLRKKIRCVGQKGFPQFHASQPPARSRSY